MSIWFILLFLIVFGFVVYYIINLLIRQRITEEFKGYPGDPLNVDDSNYFLMTSLLPGKVDIANLKEHNPQHSDYFYVDQAETKIEQTDPDVVEHRPSKLNYARMKDQLACIGEKSPIREAIKKYQPYMYDRPEIMNYYDFPYYRDWRYPERPIDPQFAINPKKYAEKYPYIYPSYRYFSKDLSNLQNF